MPKPGNETAKLLLRLRVALAGEGKVVESGGTLRARLPGEGYVAVIDDAFGTAQLLYPTGRPLSATMDIGQADAFLSFMHNVDSVVCDNPRGIPPSLMALADEIARAVDGGDARLGSLVATRDIDLGTGKGPWEPSLTCRALVEGARHAGDVRLLTSAEVVRAVIGRGGRHDEDFSAWDSRCRWGELIELWASPAADPIGAGIDTWERMATREGVTAALTRIGMGSFLHPAAIPVAMDEGPYYALRDRGGDARAVVRVVDGVVEVLMHDGGEDGAVDESLVYLRDRLGIPEPSSARTP